VAQLPTEARVALHGLIQPLQLDDLDRLAVAAQLIGRDNEAIDAWTRLHHACMRQHEVGRAARCAFWLGLAFLLKGELAQGSGWLARAQRLLHGAQQDCVERGYVLIPIALRRLAT